MANPAWDRDVDLLVRLLRSDGSLYRSAADRPLVAAAIAAVRRYPRTAAGVRDSDRAWDEVLEAVDEILVLRQARHLSAVQESGVSGDGQGVKPGTSSTR